MSTASNRGSRLIWRMRRAREELRCFVGLHRLKAWRAGESFDQVNAIPMDPRSRPGPGDYRKCDWCGAEWKGTYDGIEPHWRRA